MPTIPDDAPPPVPTHGPKGQFQKGHAPTNPHGPRPKEMREITSIARIHSAEMLLKLVHLASHAKSASVQAQCAEAVLNRAFGKPTQPVDARHTIFDAMSHNDQERLAAAIRSLNNALPLTSDPVPPLQLDLTPDEPSDS